MQLNLQNNMQYMVCCVPVSSVRKDPSHRSEIVSQQLFGEKSVVIETAKGGWAKIQMKYDGYEGWVQQSHLTPLDEEYYLRVDKDLAGEWMNEITYNGHPMIVPLGSSLGAFRNGAAFWRRNSVQYKDKPWNPEEIEITPKLIKQIAYKYLNTAYLWGGKSVFGIDCSGYAQMVYKFLNIAIPRDSSVQAQAGTTVNFLQEVQCGDLAFFDNEEGRIDHVGILLNDHEIIHSSGKVRIDKIDSEGIFNLEQKERTHKLRIIKRFF